MKEEAVMPRWIFPLVGLVLFSQVTCTLTLYLALTRDLHEAVKPVVMASMDSPRLECEGKMGLGDPIHRASETSP